MDHALIVGQQVLLIFIYIIIGIASEKTGLLSQQDGTVLSRVALMLVTPAVIINSFQRPLDTSLLANLGVVFVLAFVTHMVSAGIAVLFIRKRPDSRYRVERFGVAFANSGYMAIPLVEAVLGDVGVYYISAFIGVFNLFLWTVGQRLLDKNNKINLRKALLNPGVIGLGIGLLLHFIQLKLPFVLGQAVSSIAALNTPLSMMTAGIFLTNVNLKSTLTNARLYFSSFLKLIVVPLVMIAILWVSRIGTLFQGGNDIAMAILLACACPTAAATVQFAAQHSMEDGEYGAELVAMTTLFSVITLPLMSYLIGVVL